MKVERLLAPDIISLIATVGFGVLSLAGAVTIVLTPTITNVLALGALASVLMTSISFISFNRRRALRRHRYTTVASEVAIRVELGSRPSSPGVQEPICYVERKRQLKPLHAFQKDLEVSMKIDDELDSPMDEIIARLNYRASLKSKKRGPMGVDSQLTFPPKRPLDIKLAFDPLHRSEEIELSEYFVSPNTYMDTHEFYLVFMSNPTKEHVTRIDFHGLNISHAQYETTTPRQEPDVGTVSIQPMPGGICRIEHRWRRPEVGQGLKLSWAWDADALCRWRMPRE